MNFKAFEEFKSFILSKRVWLDEWARSYADTEFRDRQLVKIFYYYNARPMGETDWKKVIDSWLEKNWNKKESSPSFAKKPGDVIAMQSRKGEQGGVDQWQPIRDKLNEMSHDKAACPKCYNSGIIEAYRKDDKHQNRFCFTCNCLAGETARELPENRPNKIRPWSNRVGEWVGSDDSSKNECPF